MDNNHNTHGVLSFLTHMAKYGKGESTYAELETQFDITPYSNPGNRAKKLWMRYTASDCDTPEEYVSRLSPMRWSGTGDTSTVISNLTGVVDEHPGDKRDWSFTNRGESAYFEGVTEKCITSLEEAIEFCRADMNMWDAVDWKFKSWDVTMKIKEIEIIDEKPIVTTRAVKRTNYGVTVKFERKDRSGEIFADILKEAQDAMAVRKIPKLKGTGTGVVSLADFHIGADVKELIKTPDFDISILINQLSKVAAIINSYEYEQVHMNLLGDYFESISGLNHLNTFKSLARGGYGAKVMILASDILADFLSQINNLVAVNMISGNHDRVTILKTVDNEGAAAEVLAHILSIKLPGITMTYHSYLISKEIDGIGYVLTHGHFSMSRKPSANIIHRYGIKNIYNLWLEGHLHTRKTEKEWEKKPITFENTMAVSMDESEYRKLVIPSVFTGNFFSETLGYTSTGGFIITENNGYGKPHVHDYSI